MYRIFDQNTSKSFPKAAVEHVIQITFKDETFLGNANGGNVYGTFVGFLNNEFEYSAKGNYTDVFNVTKIDSLPLKLLEDTVQRNIGNYGVLTKKMYTNGESPTLTVNFRCWAANSEYAPSYAGSSVNDKNDRVSREAISNPAIVANALINATMPRVESSSILMTKNVPDTLIALAKATGDVLSEIPAVAAGETLFKGGTVSEAISKAYDTNFIGTAVEKLGDLLSKKPPVCLVKIGNIFEKDMMVVASVEVKFSKEYHQPGVPLYGDFNVTLQSLYTGSVNDSMRKTDNKQERIFGSGLNSKKGSRVTFDDRALELKDPDPLKQSTNSFGAK